MHPSTTANVINRTTTRCQAHGQCMHIPYSRGAAMTRNPQQQHMNRNGEHWRGGSNLPSQGYEHRHMEFYPNGQDNEMFSFNGRVMQDLRGPREGFYWAQHQHHDRYPCGREPYSTKTRLVSNSTLRQYPPNYTISRLYLILYLVNPKPCDYIFYPAFILCKAFLPTLASKAFCQLYLLFSARHLPTEHLYGTCQLNICKALAN